MKVNLKNKINRTIQFHYLVVALSFVGMIFLGVYSLFINSDRAIMTLFDSEMIDDNYFFLYDVAQPFFPEKGKISIESQDGEDFLRIK